MNLPNFRINIITRVVVLCGLMFALVIVLTLTQWRATPLVIGMLVMASLASLIHYVEKTNRDLDQFLNTIYHQDFSSGLPLKQGGKSFQHLSKAYDLILQSFRRLNYQKEHHLALLESVIDSLQVAVICVDRNDEITLMNKAAKKLFKMPYLYRLEGLKRVDEVLYACFSKLMSGEQHLISTKIDDELVNLAISAAEFKIGTHSYRLISCQNIIDELEQKEADAWQKLVRVLAHEIMNSATPILSLSHSIKSMLAEPVVQGGDFSGFDGDEQNDLLRSVDSIESRCRGLINFVDAYRDLTNISAPHFAVADMNQIISNATRLLQTRMDDAGIALVRQHGELKVLVNVDRQQIEQVLINLILNAIESLDSREEPRILIVINKRGLNRIVVSVEDNGCGISEENLRNIFMPFYTTKAKGTGVGLSISRQMVFMNRGLLTAESTEGKGSRFKLEFTL